MTCKKIEAFREYLHFNIIDKIDQKATIKLDNYSELRYYVENYYETKARIKFNSKRAYRLYSKRAARITNQ